MNFSKIPEFIYNGYFLLATLFCLLTLITSIWRFWFLAGKNNSIAFTEIGKVVWSSTFLNTFVPSGISGDLYKGIMLKKHIPITELTIYIIFDRIIGLYALILISTLFSPFSNVEQKAFLFFSVIISCGGFFAFLLASRLEKISAQFSPKIAAIFQSMHTFRKQAFYTLIISVIAHLLGGVSIYFLALAIDAHQHPSIFTIYSISPYALIVAAFPILPGGIGSGHIAFSFVFNQAGFKSGADIFTLYLLLQCSVALIGSLFIAKKVNLQINQNEN